MKTNRLVYSILVVLCFTACNPVYYHVNTQINKDGSIDRMIYAKADSAFMAGNSAHNPFIYNINTGWEVERLDTPQVYNFFGTPKELNARISRSVSSFGEFATLPLTREHARPLAFPSETLEKKFRWFYTYYTYKSVYPSIKDKLPVTLDGFLTPEEQELWLNGDTRGYAGLNGIELNDILDDIEKKFWKWFSRLQYELCFEVIEYYNNEVKKDVTYSTKLQEVKERICQIDFSKKHEPDYSLSDVCMMLDGYLQTNHFDQLYKECRQEMDQMIDEKSKPIEMFEIIMQYTLSMPGTVTSANSTLRENDTIVWRIDAYKLLNDDYTLSATSKVANGWAFVVTALLVLLAVYCLIRLYILKRK